MHELSIVENILEIVEKYRQERGFRRLTGITLRVGLLTAVEDEALSFAFEVLTQDGPHRGAALTVERTFPRAACGCGHSFEVTDLFYTCPACGASAARLEGGDELEVLRLEVD